MAGIIEVDTICQVGRPKNSIKFCKVCGIELTFENCRETKKGSGSLRSTCRDCEREKDKARKKAKAPHKRKRVSRGSHFTERTNRARMACQVTKIINIDHKDFIIFDDRICEECGGIYRYDEQTLERVCESCGLVDCEPVLWGAVGEFTGRQLKSYEKSKYDLSIEVNRDGQHKEVLTSNTSTYDKEYSAWYSKRLRNPRKGTQRPYEGRIKELLKIYNY